jgi:hypothetical protein
MFLLVSSSTSEKERRNSASITFLSVELERAKIGLIILTSVFLRLRALAGSGGAYALTADLELVPHLPLDTTSSTIFIRAETMKIKTVAMQDEFILGVSSSPKTRCFKINWPTTKTRQMFPI